MHRITLYLIAVFILTGCAGRRNTADLNLDERFQKGIQLMEAEKWGRAAEEFNWVVLNNPAGELAPEAQFRYAECQFHQKKYVEAQVEYERLIRRWSNTEHYGLSRYRIVQCLVEQSPKYFYQQSETVKAINELQAFIDDFPESEFKDDAEQEIFRLRDKLARKEYEAGRQYLKWRQSKSARMYFERIITLYYDTDYVDLARLGIIMSYIQAEELKEAGDFLESNMGTFTSPHIAVTARAFLDMAHKGRLRMSYYYRLYR